MHDLKDVLAAATYRRIDIDPVLDRSQTSWVRFDPVLGYVPDDIDIQDGPDDRYSTYRFEPTGERKIINGAGQPCRINTYGDSYTFCQQVSDGQTWQEYLAGHIGEPVRNFGNGGYGVYTAYRRARRMEATEECSGDYIILGIYDDDHIRSLDAARWIRTQWRRRNRISKRPAPLHGLPWAHVRFDLDKGCFVEMPGVCKNDDDLRALCDPGNFYEMFKDDQIAKIFTIRTGGRVDNVDELQALAEVFGVKVDLKNKDLEQRAEDARQLHLAYGLSSTEYILDKMQAWCAEVGKKLLIVLFYADSEIHKIINDNWRFDPGFIEYLDRSGIPYVDILRKHAEDYKAYNITTVEYCARYCIGAKGAAVFGHYGPEGNFWTAMNIAEEVIDWLDPKPPAYRDR